MIFAYGNRSARLVDVSKTLSLLMFGSLEQVF